MKVLAFLALISLAKAATQFSFQDPNTNDTCILLELDGTLDIAAFEGTTSKGTKNVDFKDAKVLPKSSDCNKLVLDLSTTIQVWFVQAASGAFFNVFPESTFNAKTLFNLDMKASPVFKGDNIGSYSANQSYSCAAPGGQNLTQTSPATNYTFTVDLNVQNFKIQFGYIANDSFAPGPDCTDTTVSPSPTSPTSPTTASPSPGPTSTKAPPTPKTGDYNVTNEAGNVTCIKVEGAFKIAVSYQNTKKENVTYDTVVPVGAMSNGSCALKGNDSISEIDIYFDPGTGSNWVLKYTFLKDDASHYEVSEIALTYSNLPDTPPAAKTATGKMASGYLKAGTSGYYTCENSQAVDIEEVKLTSSSFKYKAFNNEENIDFKGDVTECSADDTNSVVPIAVGAALAGLVVIVLIAYLIGRRRSRKSGYESV